MAIEKIANNIGLDWIGQIKEAILAKAPEWGMRFIGAIITFIIGWYIIKWINKGIRKYFEAKEFDPGLESFLMSLISIILKICLILTTLTTLGMELTSFMAIFGSAGLAIGLAFSGTLSNFAGGIIVLLFKPYKVGDVIEAQGYTGTVDSILIFNTYLKTLDTKTVIIPNGKLATETLVNYSKDAERRLIWTFSVAYGDNLNLAKKVILDTILSEPRIILKKEEPLIAVSKLNSSSVDFTARAWVKSEDYWDVFWDINEKMHKNLPENGLHIPFPQMDLHIKK